MNSIQIGKFTLESLTTGMYSDPFIIFREYIQNSTDAIDKAINNGIIQDIDSSYVKITLDLKEKFISIKDNGFGVEAKRAWNTLCDIGNSSKDFNKDRGFRGIGRLGGLTYCDELHFITSAKGESTKTIIKWDSKRLKELLQPGKFLDYDLSKVINEVTKIIHEEESDISHYFEVRLVGINEQHNILLDEKKVCSYLSQVAPIPFHAQHFVFYHDCSIGIKKQLEKIKKPLEEYYIYVNGDPNPLYKPYKNHVKAGKGETLKRDSIRDIKHFVEYDTNGEVFFWGWYAITSFLGYIKDESVAGIRVRKHNILIGDSNTLDSYFKQTRFNKWFIGEIYVYDNNILPNARRDDFEKNKTYDLFKKKLEMITRNELSKLPSIYSEYNAATNKIEKKDEELKEIEEKVKIGVSSESERKDLHKKRDNIISEIQMNKKKLEKVKHKFSDDVKTSIEKTLKAASDIHNKAKVIENDIIDANYSIFKDPSLSGYKKEVKKIVLRIFDILDKNLDSLLAGQIEKNILDDLKTNKKSK